MDKRARSESFFFAPVYHQRPLNKKGLVLDLLHQKFITNKWNRKCVDMATEKYKRSFLLGSLLFLFVGAFSTPLPIIDNSQTKLLQSQLNRYYEIARTGGWGKIILGKKYYMRGESSETVRQVKKRLQATGDYDEKDNTPLFTDELADAIRKVRKRLGLPVIGSIDAPLVKALNVPVQKRIAQLQSNIQRLESLKINSKGTQLVANIPEYKLHVYENGNEVMNMDIVVGKSSTKTVAFYDQMSHIVFSPYWNVPSSIVRNEILPAMRSNKNYLRNNGYEIVGREGGLPSIRQKPAAGNSLGRVKFLFPNSHNIYFHDTPAKSLFKMDKRAFSHGCVRLSEPEELANYLLRNDPSWNAGKINKAMHSTKEQWVKLSQPVPVAIVYFTAWVDEDGQLNFRDDIYGRDKKTPDMNALAKH